MTEEEAQENFRLITNHINNYRLETLNNYVCIAGDFEDLKNSSIYQLIRTKSGKLGYDSVYDLIKEEFGYSKSTVNNYIGVAKRFGERFSFIQEDYKGYDISQLVEMLSLDNVQITKVTPQMTCAEIRALKSKPKKIDDFTPSPNTQLLVNFSQEIFDKIIACAKKQKITPVLFISQSMEFYIENVLIE
jgi:hypothetical protein